MRLSDGVKPNILIFTNSTTSSITSPAIDLSEAHDFMVMVNMGTVSTVGSPAPVKMSLQAATASTGTVATIASGITAMASGSTQTEVSEARIFITGTMATSGGSSAVIVCDGVTLTKSSGTNGTVATAARFMSSGSTVMVLSLETVIPQVCTNLQCTRITTAATACEVKIYPKIAGYTFDIKTTAVANQTGDHFGLIGVRKTFTYDFSGADITAKNSSYSHAFVNVCNTLSSVIPMNVSILAKTRYKPASRYPDRAMCSTVSSAYSS